MKRPVRRILRSGVSLALAAATLWTVSTAAPAGTPEEALRALDAGSALSLALLRMERGDLFADAALSFPSKLALRQTPLLLAWSAASSEPAVDSEAQIAPDTAKPEETRPKQPKEEEPSPPSEPHAARDNGVPSTTLLPGDPTLFLAHGKVLVHNTSAASLTEDQLGADFTAKWHADAPQVLILHTHGCEAYTMPPGEEYVPSDDYRTLDEAYNVVRVGDEIARVLTESGVGVVHDRTLHDYPSYSGAYNRSLETVEAYLAQYPSLVYILDVHRDAVADEDGVQYKLLCAEEPGTAQLEFVIGSDGGGLEHAHWRENLALACAVQSTLLDRFPTLMRPIVVRNSRYNQQAATGSLLLEVGTAGNSLDEALSAARLFAAGFAETIRP